MKFAVFSVSTPTYTPTELAAKLKEIGYDGIEWRVIDEKPDAKAPGFWEGNKASLPVTDFDTKAADYKAITTDVGLDVPALGTYVKCDDLETVEILMKGAAAMGVAKIRVGVPSYDNSLAYTPLFDAAREQYKRVAELAEKYSVKAMIEMHHRSITPSASATRRFLDGLDPAHVGAIHDAGNMVFEGFEAYRMSFEVLGPYLAHVHVKNARWFPVKSLPDGTVTWMADWAPIAKGSADLRDLFAALEHIGYDDWISVEDFSLERPLEERLQTNLDYLTALWVESVAAASPDEPLADEATTENTADAS
ncbi:MAG: sugar phosphate isomerase/epimerase family protein [Thermomicrobiales bacterium]